MTPQKRAKRFLKDKKRKVWMNQTRSSRMAGSAFNTSFLLSEANVGVGRSVGVESETARSVPTSVRLRSSLRSKLQAYAVQRKISLSEVVQEGLDEWFRMKQCPGIYFASESGGRTAKIAGTGLGVWEVMRGTSTGDKLSSIFPNLSKAQITAAAQYYRLFKSEVDREIQENLRLTPDEVSRRYPGIFRDL